MNQLNKTIFDYKQLLLNNQSTKILNSFKKMCLTKKMLAFQSRYDFYKTETNNLDRLIAICCIVFGITLPQVGRVYK